MGYEFGGEGRNTMDFDEFKKEIQNQMNERLSGTDIGGKFYLNENVKSGLGTVTGIALRRSDLVVAPCMYINDAYKEYKQYDLTIDSIHTYLPPLFDINILS